MKKILFLLLAIVASSFVFTKIFALPISHAPKQPFLTEQESQQTAASRSSLIVPYWGLETPLPATSYDEVLYFGIEPTEDGMINTQEAGYLRLGAFQNLQSNTAKTLLVLRMINSQQSFHIIENEKNKQTLISQTVAFAKENGFDGVVLDLEVQALPFDSVIKNISTFTQAFSQAAGKEQLSFGMFVYGDVFYRLRPFDTKTLGAHVDQLYIMAYDFHKARGNPGPNFPLSGEEQYGYDMREMIREFKDVVPSEKITVVFGMFGYDWEVSENGNATQTGEAKSLHDIRQFLQTCSSCRVTRDSASGETKVSYMATDGTMHVLWFEDMESAAKKEAYLREQGITSFSFWAHTYF